MKKLTEKEQNIANQLLQLKKEAGSHSPSLFTIKEKIKELEIKVDACFISNPYATELFLKYFKAELLDTGVIRDVLEFYPSQNNVIAGVLASHLGVSADSIFIGNGAIEIIQAIMHNYTTQKVLINIPTFSSYYEFAKDDIEVIYHQLKKENDYNLNIEEYISIIKKEKPDTIVIINPNNPNGGYIPYNDIKKILAAIPEVKNVILDESFIHFAFEDDNLDLRSCIDLCEDYENLIILKSMSKDFGIAGIRAGYAVLHPDRVKALLKNGYLWNSNGLSEYFFRLYTREDFLTQYEIVRKRYILETQNFFHVISKIKGIKVYPSLANFALVEILEDYTSDEIIQLLLIKYGIYVRTCSDKIGLTEGNFIRIASRGLEENQQITKALKAIFM